MRTALRICSYWFVPAGLGLLLSGCMQATIGSVAGGECKIFERPAYVVLGKRPYDQDWIDSQVEGGVGGCKWKRPAPRPPELDAVPVKSKAAAVKPKRGFVKRITDRFKQSWPPAAAPAGPAPAPVVTPAPVVEPPPPPPKPRSAIEELLQPGGRQ